MSRITVLPLAAAALLGCISSASALTYCVAPENSCPAGQNLSTFQAALDAAGTSPEADKIQLGAAGYTAPTAAGFDYTATNPVEIAGKGTSTTLTGPNGTGTVLDLSAVTTSGSLHDLRITLPANAPAGAQALRSRILVTHVTVDANPAQSNSQTLVYLVGGASLTHSTVTGDMSGGVQSTGVLVQDPGSSAVDDVVTARVGIEDAGSTTIDRVRVTALAAGVIPGQNASVSNCAVAMANDSSSSAIAVYVTGITVTNCTLSGPSGSTFNTGVYCSGAFGASSVTVANTIVRNMGGHSIFANTAGNPASVTVRYSEFDPAKAGASGANGTLTLGPGNRWDADLGFLDAGGGDLRPRYDSPLVDRGDPTTTGTVDLQNYQRVVDGDGTGGAAVDIGAYEYPRQGPEPSIDDGPSAGDAGVELTFTGSADDPDPGETPLLTYAWQVGDGAVVPGATLKHTFTYGGTYTLHFYATDVTGVVAKTDYPVVITGPAPPAPPSGSGNGGVPSGGGSGGTAPDGGSGPGGGAGPGAGSQPGGSGSPGGGDGTSAVVDTRAPILTKVRVRRGAVTGLVDEAARVEVRLIRLGAKAKPIRRSTSVGAAGAFRIRLGRMSRGRYRIVLRAVDAAGNRSRAIARKVHR